MDQKTLVRYDAVSQYMSNQTEEGWNRLLNRIMSELDGVNVTLKEKAQGFENRSVRVNVRGGEGFLLINPEGYGEPEAYDGDGCPVHLELYQNDLQVVISPNINDAGERRIISLENAREDKRHKVKGEYVNGLCPDCQEPISDDALIGDECPNCGHVFSFAQPTDDGT